MSVKHVSIFLFLIMFFNTIFISPNNQKTNINIVFSIKERYSNFIFTWIKDNFWWKIKLLDYFSRCLKMFIDCFIDQFFHSKSYIKLRIQESFYFHSTNVLTFIFMEKIGKKKILQERWFLFFWKEKLYFFQFLGRESLKTYSFLDLSEREILFSFYHDNF